MKKDTSQSTPPPVTVAALRNHFKSTYKLQDDQVELMIRSSKSSLNKVFFSAREAFKLQDVCGALFRVGHSLKGLLLNMGEPQWADVARKLENAAKNGENRNYKAMVEVLEKGMAEIMEYTPEQ